jgi:MSHA pilin protein MshA
MFKQQSGFTLVELVIVIVILGLLAATALPRFINVTRDARIASVNGLAGGLRSATSLAKAQWMVTGSTSAVSVTMDGVVVNVNASGYPDADANGITAAMQGLDGYTPIYTAPVDTGTAEFRPSNGGNATCYARYTANTGLVTTDSNGC